MRRYTEERVRLAEERAALRLRIEEFDRNIASAHAEAGRLIQLYQSGFMLTEDEFEKQVKIQEKLIETIDREREVLKYRQTVLTERAERLAERTGEAPEADRTGSGRLRRR
jgi:hypothetical protein